MTHELVQGADVPEDLRTVEITGPLKLFGRGRLAQEARLVDWSSTALGSPETWSVQLRVAIGICTKSATPCALFVGPLFGIVFNPSYAEEILEGKLQLLGADVKEIAAERGERALAILEGIVTTGEALADASSFTRLLNPDLAEMADSTLEPVPGDEGIIGVLHRLNIQARQARRNGNSAIYAELQHRTYNLLAVVRAIFSETIAEASSLQDFKRHFSDRLAALSRVHGLLGRSANGRATIGQLFKLEFEAMAKDDRRIELAGPDVEIKASSIQVLFLAIHELCMSALTYGALSHPEGKLCVTWHTSEDPEGKRLLEIVWEERYGQGISPNDGRGKFGRQLIEQALPYQLGTETRFEVRSDLMVCTLRIPLPNKRLRD